MKNAIHLFFFLLLALAGCKSCDRESPKPDPCKDQYRTSADFKVEESLGDYWIECDSVYGSTDQNRVRFTAKFDADSFIWTIGRETIRTKSFFRTSFPQGQWIPVKLKVFRKNPSNDCFPGDVGVDSMTRSIYVWPKENIYNPVTGSYNRVNPMPIQGRYIGYYESNPTKQVEIVIRDTSIWCPDQYFIALYQENIPDGYKSIISDNPSFENRCDHIVSLWTKTPVAARAYTFRSYRNYNGTQNFDSTIVGTKCFMFLDRSIKKIKIEISYRKGYDQNNSIKNEVFYGTKIY